MLAYALCLKKRHWCCTL